MKWLNTMLAAIALLGVAAAAPAQAHGRFVHHRAHVGVFIGAPAFAPWYWPPPYYWPPAVVAVPAQPPVYIERGSADAPETVYFYYCEKPAGYHPYVKECPGGWLKVVPQAPRAGTGAPR